MGKYTKVEEKLIEEIEKYPALWNTKDTNYKNKNIKENAWQIVTDAVNAACQSTYSVNDYRDRIWKNLRDSYVRVLSGNGKKSGAGVDEIPHYPYLLAMSFLKPYVNIRTKNSDSNFQPVVLSSPCQDPLTITSEPSTDDLTVGIEAFSQESFPSFEIIENVQNVASKQPSKKRSYAAMSQKQLDRALDVKIMEYISGGEKSLQNQSAMVTIEDAFGKSVAAQLHLLDKEAKVRQ
ncbi:uncharacterized protein LOC124441067 [Xenia sp. Carnegie-2017]|uniref:uncharacterized protein LOC124441067 n=1 Tax=Xenia sp. Carnegie-2017 TaxID=2897299 RepID=UPI001F034976|nr:uncharacterized protein LOC124441067 [Xenia sp. Carnegie-2017]